MWNIVCQFLHDDGINMLQKWYFYYTKRVHKFKKA